MEIVSLFTVFTCVFLLTSYVKFRFSNYCKLGAKLPTLNKCMSFDLVKKLWVHENEIFSAIKDIIKKTNDHNKDLAAIWLGPILVVEIKNHDDLEQVLTSRKLLTKAFQYKFMHEWLGSGLLTSTGELWHTRRKLINPTFHFKMFHGFVDIINSHLDILLSKLKDKADSQPFNIEDTLAEYSLDVIAEVAMSTKVNAQNGCSSFAKAIKEITDCVMSRGFTLFYYVDWIYNLSSMRQKEKKSLEIISETVDSMVNSKKSMIKNQTREGDKKTFIEILVEAESAGILDLQGVKDEVNTLLLAGHDTIGTTVGFALHLLSKHPEIQENVYKEISNVMDGKTGDFNYNELMSLKYLERVVKETLRLYPTVPIIARTAVEDFALKSGHVLPAGTTLLIFIYNLHRNGEVFPDPEKFDPDRFLPENCAQIHPYSYLPFSAGYRNCIGQKFGMIHVKAVLAALIRNFKIIPTGQKIHEVVALVIRSRDGINIALEKR